VNNYSETDKAALQKFLEQVLEDLISHENSWPFLKPVDPAEVPDYYEFIKDPIDLKTIGERLATKQYYITKDIFFADIRRMCNNCRIYNGDQSRYTTYANELEKVLNKWTPSDIKSK